MTACPRSCLHSWPTPSPRPAGMMLTTARTHEHGDGERERERERDPHTPTHTHTHPPQTHHTQPTHTHTHEQTETDTNTAGKRCDLKATPAVQLQRMSNQVVLSERAEKPVGQCHENSQSRKHAESAHDLGHGQRGAFMKALPTKAR